MRRVTKSEFNHAVNMLGQVYGQQLYVVEVMDRMYISMYNDTIKCQSEYVLNLPNKYNNENYQIIIGYYAGLTRVPYKYKD